MARNWGPIYLAAAASIWGSGYVVSKVVLDVIPPLMLVWLRYLIALVALVLVGLATRQSWRIRRKDIPLVAAIGLSGYALSSIAQFIGTKLSTAQMGAVITASAPSFMLLFGRLLLGEQVTWRKLLSMVCAAAGVLMITGVGAPIGTGEGAILLVVAALTWAVMSVLVKCVPVSYSLLVVTSYAMAVAFACMTPIVIFLWPADISALWHLGTGSGALYIGIVVTAGAFFLWNKGVQLVDAASAGLFFFFQPLVGTLLGWLLLNERTGIGFWVGSILIITGVVLVVLPTESERQVLLKGKLGAWRKRD